MQDGDTVCVAQGTYSPFPGGSVANWSNKRVNLLGGFQSINGERDPNAYPTILEALPSRDGIYIQNSAYSLISGFTIQHRRFGLRSQNSKIRIDNVKFRANMEPVNVTSSFSSSNDFIITNSLFELNQQAAFFNYKTTIDKTIFKNNLNGGINFLGTRTATPAGPLKVTNSLFVGNRIAFNGNAILVQHNADVQLINSTFALNNSPNKQSIFYYCPTPRTGPCVPLVLKNVIEWDNSLFAVNGNASISAQNSILRNIADPSQYGPNNSNIDPHFAVNNGDPLSASNDFHLTAFSVAAINQGAYPAPVYDLDGVRRDSTPDIGAYEFRP